MAALAPKKKPGLGNKMAMITNIRHFLDEDGNLPDLPDEAKKLVAFLSSVIESATGSYGLPVSFAQVECMRTTCLLYTSPSPRDRQKTRMPSSA